MKKILALVLCLMMALSMTAFADATAPVVAIEDLYDGTWVQFEDGFELYLPSNWYQYELSEEHIANGIFFSAGTEDMAYSCTLAWYPLEREMTIEEVQTLMAGVYPEAGVVEVNGVGLVAYTDTVNGLLNCIALDATEPGYYLFAFYPSDDADFQLLASLIASTIRNIPVAE